MKRTIPSLILVGCGLLLALPAAAYDYLPLEQGNYWHYYSPADPDSTVEASIDGTYEGLAIINKIVMYQGVVSDRTQRWTAERTADDDVYIHHLSTSLDGPFAAIEPPLLLIDAPLEVGKTWSQSYQAMGAPFQSDFAVLAEVDIETTCGVLHCYLVEHAQSGYWTITQYFWFADGFGIVRIAEGAYFDAVVHCTVPVEAKTLSDVKDLFK